LLPRRSCSTESCARIFFTKDDDRFVSFVLFSSPAWEKLWPRLAKKTPGLLGAGGLVALAIFNGLALVAAGAAGNP
jgi:hypothetical protein